MRIDALARRLDELYRDDRRVAFVIATFGSTDAFGIDDIGEIRQLLEDKARQYERPIPQLHVDAAVGWVLCFFHEYDTRSNPLELGPEVVADVEAAKRKASMLRYADSITIDFHKMGWGHYPASAFIVNRRDDLQCLFRDVEDIPYFSEAQYRRDPALFTLECSRPAIGPYSVMASLNGIGLVGYQVLIAHGMELARYLRTRLDELDFCKVLNGRCPGTHAVWWTLPKGRNAAEIFRRFEAGEVTDADAQRYFDEIERLFHKRSAARNPDKDAMLSFTTSMGYAPHGRHLPGWKAVFFNPLTDRQVVDDIVISLEEAL
jgi:glutamate/tyrosine decarboxylase-like PLP-dependent enzyme